MTGRGRKPVFEVKALVVASDDMMVEKIRRNTKIRIE